jgi:hypothetical protein
VRAGNARRRRLMPSHGGHSRLTLANLCGDKENMILLCSDSRLIPLSVAGRLRKRTPNSILSVV